MEELLKLLDSYIEREAKLVKQRLDNIAANGYSSLDEIGACEHEHAREVLTEVREHLIGQNKQ